VRDIPFIYGQNIYLRELRESDLDGPWYSWFNDSEVTTFQNKGVFPNTREKQKAYYNSLLTGNNTDVVFAIIEESSNKHIGNVGLHKIDWIHRSAELGIVIGDKDAWGKKYGKEAWKLVSGYGIQVLNLHRIYAQIMEGNVASCKSAEAAGFKQEGLITDAFFKNGKYLHVRYYNLVNPNS
jgi:ribosomal-protein-alanine N-acetyltransferase